MLIKCFVRLGGTVLLIETCCEISNKASPASPMKYAWVNIHTIATHTDESTIIIIMILCNILQLQNNYVAYWLECLLYQNLIWQFPV